MPAILTLTLNPALDKITHVDHVVPEHKLRCAAPTYDAGGGGINVARAAHELQGDVEAVWLAGGPIGTLLNERLDEEGVRHHPIPIEGITRENLIVGETASGQQYRFGMPGPTVYQHEVNRCVERLAQFNPAPRFLVLSGSLPPGLDASVWGQVIRNASKESRVVLDTSGEPLRRGIEEGVFLIKPNIRELGELTGRDLSGDPAIFAAARQLVADQRAEVVVTSLGSGGAVLVTADLQLHLRSPTVPIRSKVGAGDSTVAGIVVALARGWEILEAVKFGIAAGAAAAMTEGTQLCRREDTERLYRESQSSQESHASSRGDKE